MKKKNRLIPIIPAAFTLANLLCGFVAMAKAADALQASRGAGPFDQEFSRLILHGCWFIIAGMIFDGLDGRIARLTHQTSPFGAMLDSLSDMVTFGMAPAFMAKVAYEHGMREMGLIYRPPVVTLLCALFVMAAALRLARFTVMKKDENLGVNTFAGLPSPAAAVTLMGALFFIFESHTELGMISAETTQTLRELLLRGLPGVAVILGLLMVSKVPYIHLSNKYIGHRVGPGTVIRLAVFFMAIAIFHEWFLFAASLTYVLGGMWMAWRAKSKGTKVDYEFPAPSTFGLDGDDGDDDIKDTLT